MIELLNYSFFQHALIAGVLSSIACGVIGTFVVVKRYASISGGISHAALGGVGLGYFFGFSPMLGATLVAIAAAVYIGRQYFINRESLDSLIAIVWSFGMAVGVLLVSLTPGYVPDLSGYLFGSIVFVSKPYLVITALLDLVIIITVYVLFNYLKAVSFDEEFAEVRGLPVKKLFLLLLIISSLTVVVLMKVVGVIMLIALLTIPAVIARRYSSGLTAMIFLSIGVSLFATIAGLFLSAWLSIKYSVNTPSGALIILVSLAVFAVSSMTNQLGQKASRN